MFISLTSDFDLDAAFMSSSLPYLSLKVEPVVCSGNVRFYLIIFVHIYACDKFGDILWLIFTVRQDNKKTLSDIS